MRRAAYPTLDDLVETSIQHRNTALWGPALTLRLQGDGVHVSRDAAGARAYRERDDGLRLMQELRLGSSLGAGNEPALRFGWGGRRAREPLAYGRNPGRDAARLLYGDARHPVRARGGVRSRGPVTGSASRRRNCRNDSPRAWLRHRRPAAGGALRPRHRTRRRRKR